MTPHDPPPTGPDRDPFARVFPSLPIVSLDPDRRPDREKYGALFYLGTVGLVVIVALVGWFAWQAWSLRTVWANVYTLHDARRSESDRVQAAYALAVDPAVNQRQRWDNALSKSLPPLARYVLAESLTAEAASDAPRDYGAAVARSEGWPDWLRLLLTRPMAYAAALDLPVARDHLATLSRGDDHCTALWATYALAEGSAGDPASAAALRLAAGSEGTDGPLALALVAALDATRLDDRLKALDSATLWLRTHHPGAARLWDGWRVVGNRLVRTP
ncbi:MAG: hypothetical protein LC745_05880 [Planctomycetia bacterium]|nr:hypothetical protein [Planctomycetia bacterium]